MKMSADTKLLLQAGIAGGAVAALAWFGFSKLLDSQFETQAHDLLAELKPQLRQQIKSQLDSEVPKQVRAEMEATLRDFGLTPETGRRIDRILSAADRVGLLGLRRAV